MGQNLYAIWQCYGVTWFSDAPFYHKTNEKFTITDERMTRFMITLEEGVKLVWHAFETMRGGEIYVKKFHEYYGYCESGRSKFKN